MEATPRLYRLAIKRSLLFAGLDRKVNEATSSAHTLNGWECGRYGTAGFEVEKTASCPSGNSALNVRWRLNQAILHQADASLLLPGPNTDVNISKLPEPRFSAPGSDR
jgi:hypothetical protein